MFNTTCYEADNSIDAAVVYFPLQYLVITIFQEAYILVLGLHDCETCSAWRMNEVNFISDFNDQLYSFDKMQSPKNLLFEKLFSRVVSVLIRFDFYWDNQCTKEIFYIWMIST